MVGRLQSSEKLREYMAAYYQDAKSAEINNKKVGWITSGGPVEFLIAMDIIPVYPENHGAMIGAAHQGGMLCAFAEQRGFSKDICSYARSDIGGLLSENPSQKGPIGGLPKPNMLICCNNICGTVMKWYETVSRYLDVPLFIIDTPVIHSFPIPPEVVEYVALQFKEYIVFLESITKKKFNMDMLAEVSLIANKNTEIWNTVLESCVKRPAPMTAFDAFTHMAPIVTLRGTQSVTNYYLTLLKELNERIEQGIGSVENEHFRLLWDNIPVWHKMRDLSNFFASCDANIVADTYTNAWGLINIPIEIEKDILRAYAKAYTQFT
jgi:benzoyl-CoA reductase/2-hydroxyglutaryl-CoA dehydratase subunit BcrC/BadD/HgdB